jgi:hypothetical protein
MIEMVTLHGYSGSLQSYESTQSFTAQSNMRKSFNWDESCRIEDMFTKQQ